MAAKQITDKDHWLGIRQALVEDGTDIKIKSSLRVEDFMRMPFLLKESDSLKSAADIILNHRIDGIAIVDKNEHLVGMVTKTVVLRELRAGQDLNTPVGQVMITDPISINPHADVSSLITLNVGNLPVVDNGKVTGIVTLSDTIRAYFSSIITLREELYAIIDSTHNGILTVNETGRIILINKAAADFLDLNRADVVGMPIEIIAPKTNLLEVIKLGRGVNGRKFQYKERGFISNQTPVISDGEIIGAVSVFQDISELESISEELEFTKRMKEELDAIINSSFDGIHITDEHGKTLRVNDAFTRIIGVSRDQVVGKPMQDLVQDGVYARPITEMVEKSRKAVTISQKSKPGNTVVITANPVFNYQGQLFRTVINARDMTELNVLKRDLEQAKNLSDIYRERLDKAELSDKYVVRSQRSRELVDLCIRLGQFHATVLIQGESGVGKEITARIIHSNSTRRDKPMVSVNCAAIPESLLESELFGYAPGAFTGASKNGKAGIFETAHGGTLFLDEVADLPLNLQAKVLRAIQEKEITPVGSNTPINVDIRLIASTNRDLQEMVNAKEFRKDLFFRLNVIPITVPPLRERKTEIPFFVAHFLKKFNTKYNLNKRIDERVIKDFMAYDWPGNIRELENLIERLLVTYPGDVIRHVDLKETSSGLQQNQYQDFFTGYKLQTATEQLEKHLIETAIETYSTTRKAAVELGVSQSTIVRKAAKYGIRLRDA